MIELADRNEDDLLHRLAVLKKDVSPILARIIITFPEYTSHDVTHSERILNKLNLLIPEPLMKKLNSYEIYFLIASAYLHDIGMVNLPEYKEPEFLEFDDDPENQTKDQKNKIRDIIRERHHIRSEKMCTEMFVNNFGDFQQAEIIGLICRGHRKENLHDEDLFNSKTMFEDKPINIPLLASLIRNGDELDIT